MVRWNYDTSKNRVNYAPYNQTHDPDTIVYTFQPRDDKNRAAVQYRGMNTSENHYTGENFKNLPMGDAGAQNFYPRPRWHFTTAHIRNEPTWVNPPKSANAYLSNRERVVKSSSRYGAKF